MRRDDCFNLILHHIDNNDTNIALTLFREAYTGPLTISFFLDFCKSRISLPHTPLPKFTNFFSSISKELYQTGCIHSDEMVSYIGIFRNLFVHNNINIRGAIFNFLFTLCRESPNHVFFMLLMSKSVKDKTLLVKSIALNFLTKSLSNQKSLDKLLDNLSFKHVESFLSIYNTEFLEKTLNFIDQYLETIKGLPDYKRAKKRFITSKKSKLIALVNRPNQEITNKVMDIILKYLDGEKDYCSLFEHSNKEIQRKAILKIYGGSTMGLEKLKKILLRSGPSDNNLKLMVYPDVKDSVNIILPLLENGIIQVKNEILRMEEKYGWGLEFNVTIALLCALNREDRFDSVKIHKIDIYYLFMKIIRTPRILNANRIPKMLRKLMFENFVIEIDNEWKKKFYGKLEKIGSENKEFRTIVEEFVRFQNEKAPWDEVTAEYHEKLERARMKRIQILRELKQIMNHIQ